MNSTLENFPEPPSREHWDFIKELKQPEPVTVTWTRNTPGSQELNLTPGLTVITQFQDPDNLLETAVSDLRHFLKETDLTPHGQPIPLYLTLIPQLDGRESYEVTVRENLIQLTAQDLEGLRRAIFYLENQITAQDGPFLELGTVRRKPWLRNRISRCFFSPIKRPPYNRDELLDDIDYYPDEYLNRLAHEGINGLWLTVVFRELAQTSFTPRDPQAPQRLEKLRKTIAQCLRYGIKTWIFAIEPKSLQEDDPLLKVCPEFKGPKGWDGAYAFCTSSPRAHQYLRETMYDIFSQLPGLGGFLNITHGERITNCLSTVPATDNRKPYCPRCSQLPAWKIHQQEMQAMAEGMRQANPDAEIISWFYQPQPAPTRAEWLYTIPQDLPENVTLQYNFESGAQKQQLGKVRSGGDYWLSVAEPSEIFRRLAQQASQTHTPLAAKIQVGCSHEVATIPFVPVPGLLYRKYKAMKECGCSSVMQCWYFGNYPGTMNRAAGELAFETFQDTEEDFLLRLASPQWGRDAKNVAQAWKIFSDAYQNYPLSNDMQYYGPVHAGITWPLMVLQQNLPLAPTWKPDFPPAGDSIGECLENHTLPEAFTLLKRMADTWNRGMQCLQKLGNTYQDNRPRALDLDLAQALNIQLNSARNNLEFYLQRTRLNDLGEQLPQRLQALQRMRELILQEQLLTQMLIPLCQTDSRLGFHSEAEANLYSVERLQWRLQWLQQQLDGPVQLLEQELPLDPQATVKNSPFLASVHTVDTKAGVWQQDGLLTWRVSTRNMPQELVLELQSAQPDATVTATFLNRHLTSFPQHVTVNGVEVTDSRDLVTATVTANERGWKAVIAMPVLAWEPDGIFKGCFLYLRIHHPQQHTTWPPEKQAPRSRLNIGPFQADHCGWLAP